MRSKLKLYFYYLTFSLLITTSLFAQDTTNTMINTPEAFQENTVNKPLPEPSESNSTTIMPLSRYEFTLSIIVLSFGLIMVLLEILLIKNKKLDAEDIIKFIILTLIITSTLFLITAGYSNNQIAPAIGLLGTVAGYLLGRTQNLNPKNNE